MFSAEGMTGNIGFIIPIICNGNDKTYGICNFELINVN
jgi:hypothetical protein